MKKRDFTICVAKTKALISCYCAADLRLCFCIFKIGFSHNQANFSLHVRERVLQNMKMAARYLAVQIASACAGLFLVY